MLLTSGRLFRNVVLSTATLLHYCSRPSAVTAAAAMSTHTTTRRDGTITVAPRNEATQSALMVICHGLGDSAEGFVDVAEVRYGSECLPVCMSGPGVVLFLTFPCICCVSFRFVPTNHSSNWPHKCHLPNSSYPRHPPNLSP